MSTWPPIINEGEILKGCTMVDMKKALKTERIGGIRLRHALCLDKSTPLREVFDAMRGKRTGCALVIEKGRLTGIFTERDAIRGVENREITPSTPLEKVMVKNPERLTMDDSVADAIRLMDKGGYRHIPIVNGKDEVTGLISARDILDYLAEHFPFEVYNLPPDPRQISVTPEGA